MSYRKGGIFWRGAFTVGIFLLFVFFSSQPLFSAQQTASSLKYEAQKLYWGRGVKKDYSKALALYEKAAAMGDSEANYIAGGMYYKGLGAFKNYFKAFTYLDYAAKNGKSSPESNRALAEFYILGDVVPQNYQKAVRWYKDSAESGDSQAQLELGFLYFVGRGVEQDFKKSFKWFEKAAHNNYNMAQYNMGMMWYTGNGTDISDVIKAYAWFSIAATNNYPDAATARDYLKSIMSKEEIDDAQKFAARLFEEIRR